MTGRWVRVDPVGTDVALDVAGLRSVRNLSLTSYEQLRNWSDGALRWAEAADAEIARLNPPASTTTLERLAQAEYNCRRLAMALYRLRLDSLAALSHAVALLEHHGHGRYVPGACSGCERIARALVPVPSLDAPAPDAVGAVSDAEFAEVLEHLRGLMHDPAGPVLAAAEHGA